MTITPSDNIKKEIDEEISDKLISEVIRNRIVIRKCRKQKTENH